MAKKKKKKTAVPALGYSIFHFKIIWSQLEELLPVDKVGAEFKRNQIRPIYQTRMFGKKDGTRKASPNPNASLYEPWIAAVS